MISRSIFSLFLSSALALILGANGQAQTTAAIQTDAAAGTTSAGEAKSKTDTTLNATQGGATSAPGGATSAGSAGASAQGGARATQGAATSAAALTEGTKATPEQAAARSEMIHRVLYAIYKRLQQHDDQVSELAALAILKPTDPTFPYLAGVVKTQQGKPEEALQSFEQAIKLNPEYADAYAMEGQAYAKMDKYQLAVDKYKLAQAHAKSGQDFNAMISVNQQLLERQQQEQAYLNALKKRGK